VSKEACSGGLSLGGIIAVVCSWTVNHSLGWAILHFFAGWFYVAYYLITYAKL
jgi:hypothetical protein